jgi:hypothetical protein
MLPLSHRLARDAPAKCNVPSSSVHNALLNLDGIDAERMAANQAGSLTESADGRQICRSASEFVGASIQECHGHTHCELMEVLVQSATANNCKSALCHEFDA